MEDLARLMENNKDTRAMKDFWQGKRVFITGHTGFKGSWLCMILDHLGARVSGYALEPATEPSLFKLCGLDNHVSNVIADIRDLEVLKGVVAAEKPEIVIHMAAQALVRHSYSFPVETYGVNVMGTVNMFEAIRACPGIKAVINVTSDKCYENRENLWWGYREEDPLGGYDPYSSSKACAEHVASAYRTSFFHPEKYLEHGVGLASVRAGNVIGGGDWSADRLVSDCIRSLLADEKIAIRNPNAIRPWQHVLEPLFGYLGLAQKLYENGGEYAEAFNFGPSHNDAVPVLALVKKLCDRWGDNAGYTVNNTSQLHEAHYLKLDCSKARFKLSWSPKWNINRTLNSIVDWTRMYQDGKNMKEVSLNQIIEYEQTAQSDS